jgi:DhnA family fructose-bisphosphate aldolase class Ia
MIGEQIRLSRLFGQGNAVVVAIDHGLYNGPLPGLIDLPGVIPSITQADAILTSPGMVAHCKSVFMQRGAPALVVRLNWGTQYATQWSYDTAQSVRVISAQEALALGADIALVGLSLKTGDQALDAHNIEVLAAYVSEKRVAGIPLIGEFYPAGAEDASPESLQQLVAIGCRIISELGVDAIKTFFTGERFREIAAATPVPILTLGARKVPLERDALRLAEMSVQAGSRGVVFGRNVVQARSPERFLAALKEVVKEGRPADSVARAYELD